MIICCHLVNGLYLSISGKPYECIGREKNPNISIMLQEIPYSVLNGDITVQTGFFGLSRNINILVNYPIMSSLIWGL